MPEENMHLKITKRDGVHVVEFLDRKILDEICIREIEEELAALVDSQPGIKLLLSFANVDHLSSAALGALITLNKQVARGEGRLKLSEISSQIYEVFKITRLNKIFDIHGTAEEALQSF
jgi:anti-sigma B factor antagonist